MKKTLCFIISFLFIFCIISSSAHADWINFSGAENALNIVEIRINDDHIKINLEIFVNDIMTFERLIPDEYFKDTDSRRPPLADRMRKFSNEDFQIITDVGQKLRARLKVIEPRLRAERYSPLVGMLDPITRRPIPGPPEDKRVFYAELVYPFQAKPKSLTIVPPIDNKGVSTVSISFITYHKGVLVCDFRYLSESSTLHLDWEDPWYSSFESRALKRWQWTGVMTFLYIEPYEVRHETLVRLKDLETWMNLGLRSKEFIEVDEFEPLKKRVSEFFLKREKVLIDGKTLKPILDKTSFVEYSRIRSQFIDRPQERMPLATAMLGVVFTYITDGIPQEVTAEWDLFSKRIPIIKANMIDPAGGFPYDLSPEDNVLKWTNFLKTYTIPTVENVRLADTIKVFRIPVGSVMCLLLLIPVVWNIMIRRRSARPYYLRCGLAVLLIAGTLLLYPYTSVTVARLGFLAPKVTKDEAMLILHSLLKNVYRAFDFREEEDVYDKLAISVSGDLLADIYLQNRKSLVVQQAGGAHAKVKEIEVLDVIVTDVPGHSDALSFRSMWTALGTVGHWGHVHIRQNQYEAIITVEPVEGAWKITDLELLEEKRIDPYGEKNT